MQLSTAASNWIAGTTADLTAIDWTGVKFNAYRYSQADTELAKGLNVYASYYWVLSFDCKGTTF